MSVRWQKNSSLGFAKGWSRLLSGCRGKPNVLPKAFGMRVAKIVFKKCAVGKNKNTEALGCRVGCLIIYFFCSYFLFHSVVHFCSGRLLGMQLTRL
jgi:hypothetical protein